MSDRCVYCRGVATVLCDGLIHVETRRYGDSIRPRGWYSCDASMCVRCARNGGKTFDLDGPGSVDTIDHCVPCDERETHTEGLRPWLDERITKGEMPIRWPLHNTQGPERGEEE